MSSLDLAAEAARMLEAHAQRRTLAPISDRHPAFTLAQAYALQDRMTQARLDRGERVVGWKLGYTSAAVRAQRGIAEPNLGPLTDAMLWPAGAPVPATLKQPRVEPEIALRFALDVPPSADRDAVLRAVGSAHAALEVVDSVWADYRSQLTDNTADGSSAAGLVLGPALPPVALDTVEVTLFADGQAVGSGRGSDASGHPAEGVVWLVRQLAARGLQLRAGDVVITGGLTPAAALNPGSRIHACFQPGGVEVAVHRPAGDA